MNGSALRLGRDGGQAGARREWVHDSIVRVLGLRWLPG